MCTYLDTVSRRPSTVVTGVEVLEKTMLQYIALRSFLLFSSVKNISKHAANRPYTIFAITADFTFRLDNRDANRTFYLYNFSLLQF